jgi:hypothetical protein
VRGVDAVVVPAAPQRLAVRLGCGRIFSRLYGGCMAVLNIP